MKRRLLATLLALCTVLAMLPGTALAANTYTFKDRQGNSVTVPVNAFAKRVVSFSHGNPWTHRAEQQKTSNILGLPDRTGNNNTSKGDLCLGTGGVVVLEFDMVFYDGPGMDIYVFEVGPSVEATAVAVSNDLITWYEAGSVAGKTAGIDLKGKIPAGGSFRYVRLTDLKKDSTGDWPGADIDAVCGVNVKPLPASYTLTFNANGGSCITKTKKVNANATYGTLPEAHRTGYTFSGWYTAKSGGTKVTSSTKATANATVYARWAKAKRTYQVTFNANGGDVLLDSKTVLLGSPYRDLPTPTRPGYHFTGWYTRTSGGTKITDRTKVNLTANQTLYAHWSTAAVRATSVKSGSWKIAIPPYYNVMLYSNNVSAAPAAYIPENSANMQTLTCTQMAQLSNGTTRYYARLASGSYYWFTYTCEMEIN